MGEVDEAVPGSPAGLAWRGCFETGATSRLNDHAKAGGPPPRAIMHRTSLELHSKRVAEHAQ
eukprot:7331466-Pyramimonas_sp.AAC.1